MARGRPTKSRISGAHSSQVWTEIIIISVDDRITISAEISRRCSWLVAGKELLAVLLPGQMIELLPYAENGPEVEKAIDELASTDDIQTTSPTQVGIMYRYLRLRVNMDSRIVVPKDVRLCLGLDPVAPSYVRINIRPNVVTIRPGLLSDYEDAENLLSGLQLP